MTIPVKEASKFVTVTGFSTTLNTTLTRYDKQLPIEITPMLRNKLKGGAFTFMTISNHVDSEVVKVFLFDNKLLIERGQDDTEATAFPKGSCINANPTWAGIKELICTLDCCAKSESSGE
ncbi:hypothetical protein V757_11630 [Pelistega indica]|uniref:Uncharacterized protein n=1 Tax=Pelistega indica TaxID=1414851 RepID=V8FTZ1_9BURK|nr:hypothetical protein [Pelistega indica]ETD67173.1 hypothetical protein V757_11630 [Pelistega indica]